MGTPIGDLIFRERKRLELTQDQFGQQYQVSGPAVFKFEKGFVNPSLRLWFRMAHDMEIDDGDAVVLWCKSKLAPEMREFIARSGKRDVLKKHGLKTGTFSHHRTPESLRKALIAAKNIPKGLQSLAQDKEVWTIYKPTGREIDRLLSAFGPYGDTKKGRWLEALRVIKSFADV